MSRALEGRGTAAALDVFAEWYYTLLRDFDYAAGCPLMAAAIEGGRTPGASAEAADGFCRWERTIAEALIRDGANEPRATEIAALAVASMEGALAMCRAKRSTEPINKVITQLQTVIHDATSQRN
ncbi:MAG: LmrA/YxaF family transcription factor [Solirubrobacteraceae bacterium]